MAELKKVGITGFGIMGIGIAQVCAQSGYTTVVRDIDQMIIDAGLKKIEKSLGKSVEKGKITSEDVKNINKRVICTTDLQDLKDCDIVIEALPEDIDLKKQTFQSLDKILSSSTIIASNTSSLSITEMATFVSNPERFMGLHFFNPVPMMKLVEIVKTIITDRGVLKSAFEFIESIGKFGITAKDNCGFIVNRLLVPYVFDAIRAFENGIGSVEDIDNGMKLGAGQPMGPFALADFVGLDMAYKIGCNMFDEYKEARFAPPDLVRKMALSGYLGLKCGKGFYDYSQNPPRVSDLNF